MSSIAGTRRMRLFHKAGAYEAFERALAEGLERWPVELLTCCLMPNPCHLVACPKTDQALARRMGCVAVPHARPHHDPHHSRAGRHLVQMTSPDGTADYDYDYTRDETFNGDGTTTVTETETNDVSGTEDGSSTHWWVMTSGSASGGGPWTSSGSTSSGWSHSYDETVDHPGFYHAAYYFSSSGGGSGEYSGYVGDAFHSGSGWGGGAYSGGGLLDSLDGGDQMMLAAEASESMAEAALDSTAPEAESAPQTSRFQHASPMWQNGADPAETPAPDPEQPAVIVDLDAAGNLLSITDALGHETTYTYDAAGNPTGVTDPNGDTSVFDGDGRRGGNHAPFDSNPLAETLGGDSGPYFAMEAGDGDGGSEGLPPPPGNDLEFHDFGSRLLEYRGDGYYRSELDLFGEPPLTEPPEEPRFDESLGIEPLDEPDVLYGRDALKGAGEAFGGFVKDYLKDAITGSSGSQSASGGGESGGFYFSHDFSLKGIHFSAGGEYGNGRGEWSLEFDATHGIDPDLPSAGKFFRDPAGSLDGLDLNAHPDLSLDGELRW